MAPQVEEFAFQMWYYLESIVSNQALSFPAEVLTPMFELYNDLSIIFLSNADVTR